MLSLKLILSLPKKQQKKWSYGDYWVQLWFFWQLPRNIYES